MLANPGYRKKALYFQNIIAEINGLDVAAVAIEKAFLIVRPDIRPEDTLEAMEI